MIAQHLAKVPKMQCSLRSSWYEREFSFHGIPPRPRNLWKTRANPALWITLLFPHQAKVSTMTILNNNTEVLMPAEACVVLAHAMIPVALAGGIGIGYWEHRSIPS